MSEETALPEVIPTAAPPAIKGHPDTALARANLLPVGNERRAAMRLAMEPTNKAGCPRPIPRFMLDLPWMEPEAVQERIIADLLASGHAYEGGDGDAETIAGRELVGRYIEIHDLAAYPSTKEGGWGAYLLVDAVIDDKAGLRRVVTIGAKQAVSILALAWAAGDLPMTGTIVVEQTTAAGNSIIGFRAEAAFE